MSRFLAAVFGALAGAFASGLVLTALAVRRLRRSRRLRHDPHRSRQ